jgi:hypothetical protein
MNDFTADIRADGGDWSEAEIDGNKAIVKVRAKPGTLNQIERGADFERLSSRAVANGRWAQRRKPRYDKQTDEIVLDGPFQPTRSLDDVDNTVSD